MSQTAAEIEARLVKVRAAIDRAILAASYSIGGRSHSNQGLTELRKLEKELMRQLSRLTGGGPFVVSSHI